MSKMVGYLNQAATEFSVQAKIGFSYQEIIHRLIDSVTYRRLLSFSPIAESLSQISQLLDIIVDPDINPSLS